MNAEIPIAQRYAEWKSPKSTDLPPYLVVNDEGQALSMDPSQPRAGRNQDVHQEEQVLRLATEKEVAAAVTGEIPVFVAEPRLGANDMPGNSMPGQERQFPSMDASAERQAPSIKSGNSII